ncbi:MAG: DUF202 domain-containing protein [Terracoccus sp.]
MTGDGQPAGAPRGMAPERTALAWSRTGLALLVAGLFVGRLALGSLGLVVVVPVALALALSGWVLVTSLRRGRWSRTVTSEGLPASVLHDGRLPAVVAVIVTLLCAGELASVLAGWI